MGKPQVLLLGKIDHAHQAWDSLSSLADLVTPTSTNRAAFIRECTSGAFDSVLAAYRTFDSVSITGPWDAELISHLPAGLRFCAHNGAGYDQIDVDACSSRAPRPILVSNVREAVDDATADAAVWLVLGALRGFGRGVVGARGGNWRGNPPQPLGHDPQGKTLGILGMGGIGRNMARKLAAFGMRAIYHNRTQLDDAQAAGAEYVSFDELLARADVLSLNLPLNSSTHHTLSTAQFAAMKPGAILINTARGPIVDEAALVAALASGQIRAAGLDVYEHEPAIHEGLRANPDVLLLPHLGTWTVETQTKMEEACIANVRSALEEGRLLSGVREQEGLV